MPGVIALNPVIIEPNQFVVHSASTVTASGSSSVYTNFEGREVALIVNITAPPTGTSPTLQYTLEELDPGDQTTILNTLVSSVITAIGTQVATLPNAQSGTFRLSWVIGGTTPSFTGVYATVRAKNSTGTITIPAAVGLATSANQTNGAQKSIVRGGDKGATVAADITGTAEGADHQGLDVQIYHGGTAINPTQVRALTSADTVTVVQPVYTNLKGTVQLRNPGDTVNLGDTTNPVRVDPTGTTAQPVTDNGGSLTIDTPQLPAALVGGRLDENVGAWLGSTAPTVGQKAMAASVPVVIASDQTAVPVSGTVTANIGTPGALALDATLTSGAQKSVVRGGAKGTTTAADVTSTNQSADRQALDVQIRTSAGVAIDSFSDTTQYAEDTPHVSGDQVTMAGVVQQTADTALSSNGDRSLLQVDSSGFLKVNVKAGSSTGTQYADGDPRGAATGILSMVDDGTNIQSVSGDTSGRVNVNIRGDKANNSVVPGSTNLGVLPSVANAAAPAYIEGNQVAASSLLNGSLRTDTTSWFGSPAPTVGQKVMASSIPVTIASDQSPVQVVVNSVSPGAVTGIRSGTVQLGGGTAGTNTVILSTAYTEQTSNAQRSFSSTSASDAAAGTGARTLLLTYLDSAGVGPYTETITLNGTTAVNTVATNICFIESMVVLTVGSVGRNVGTIRIHTTTGGGGSIFATIGIGNLVVLQGDNRTLWAMHYVPAGQTAKLATYIVSAESGGSGTNATFVLRTQNLPVGNNAEIVNSDILLVIGPLVRQLSIPIVVVGPARVRAWGVPANNNEKLNASFDFSELPT